MKQFYSLSNFSIFFISILLLFSVKISAQCAGENNSITICDIPDVANQNIDLNDLLNGTPESGGIWVSNQNLNIFVGNSNNGVINIWKITSGGTYSFTYTVSNQDCSNDSATVFITVGGYAGQDNPLANACEDDETVDLFQFIGNNPNPHLYGNWNDDDNTGALDPDYPNIFDATVQGPGIYHFTYTVPAVGSCPSQSSTVKLTVHPLPDPGSASNIELCGIENLESYTDVNLLDYISIHDSNGSWSEGETNELDGQDDLIIDVQNIYNNFGYGHYGFSYTVAPSHPVCEPRSATIQVIIRRIVDFAGTDLSVISICEDELEGHEFEVNFENLPGIEEVPNFNYEVNYSVTGPVNYTGETDITRNQPSFIIDEEFEPTVGVYHVNINSIVITNDTEDIVCSILFDLDTDFEIKPLTSLEDAEVSTPDICVGEETQVSITNADVIDGQYTVGYILSGANTATESVDLIFQNGNASFPLDQNLLENIGETTITLTSISDEYCESPADVSVTFQVNPLPDPENYRLKVESVCLGEPVSAEMANLTDLNQIKITYIIEGDNTIASETKTLNVTNNEANFSLPENTFSVAGTQTFHITHIINLETGCEVDADISAEFEIYPIPTAPQANNQEFCEADEATIADLQPNGPSVEWYDSLNAESSLPDNYSLTEMNYYVAIRNDEGCLSEKTAVSVIVNQVPPVTLITKGYLFCGNESPTLTDLSANTDQFTNYTITWYAADGTLLSSTTLLQHGETYYGVTNDEVTGCESSEELAVTVDLTDCEEEDYDFFIPDAFSPNGDGLNDTFRIPQIKFIYPNYEFEIYNRYGKLLFIGNAKHPEWNGKTAEGDVLFDGIAPNGIYFYIIKFNKNNRAPKQGRLYLNR